MSDNIPIDAQQAVNDSMCENRSLCCINPNRYDLNKLNISFAGCGFLGIYHLGVIVALQNFVPNIKFDQVCGASAGAIAGVALVAGIPASKMISILMTTVSDARKHVGGALNPNYNITKVLKETLDEILPDDIHERATGRLKISVTKVEDTHKKSKSPTRAHRVSTSNKKKKRNKNDVNVTDGENILIDNYMSKEEVIDVVICSAFIPGFSGTIPPKVRGVRIIDGGFSCNMPKITENTVTVNPFAGNATICPLDEAKVRSHDVHRVHFSDQGTDLTLANATRLLHVIFPPTPEELSKILLQGFQDGHRFLRTHGFINCSQCLEIRAQMSPCADRTDCDEYLSPIDLPSVVQDAMQACKERYYQAMENSTSLSFFSRALWGAYNLALWNPALYVADLSVRYMFNLSKSMAGKVVDLVGYIEAVTDKKLKHQLEASFGQLVRKFLEDGKKEFDLARQGDCQVPDEDDEDDEEDAPVDARQGQMGQIHMDIALMQYGQEEEISDEDSEMDEEEDGVNRPFFEMHIDAEDAVPIPNLANGEEEPADNLLAAVQGQNAVINANLSRRGSRAVSRAVSAAASRRNSVNSSRFPSLSSSRCAHCNKSPPPPYRMYNHRVLSWSAAKPSRPKTLIEAERESRANPFISREYNLLFEALVNFMKTLHESMPVLNSVALETVNPVDLLKAMDSMRTWPVIAC